MLVRKFGRVYLACLALSFICGYADASRVPAWLSSAIQSKTQASNVAASSVCLLDETVYTVASNGKRTEVIRMAYQINDLSDRGYARLEVGFEEGYSSVSEIKAWVLDPGGKVYKYNKKDTWDIASDIRSLHSQLMERRLDAQGDIREGSVFAYEYTVTKKSIFSQMIWRLNRNIPVLLTRVSIEPPPGWAVKATPLNGAQVQEKHGGRSYAWEARNLEAIEGEAGSPVARAYLPFVGFDLYPEDGASKGSLELFSSWNDVARFDVRTNDSQTEPSDGIRRKVTELVNGKTGVLEKVEALAEYAQSVNYVSIQTDLSMGGGYKPFPAAEVFERHYGDCKDKAALLRSMLGCIDVESYAVSIASEDAAYLDLNWPSPQQFDHCIVAIAVEPESKMQALVEDAVLGKMLLFDPTSQNTPFGMLPQRYHGGFALVGSERVTGPTPIPQAIPEQNSEKRTARIELMGDGSAVAAFEFEYKGGRALAARATHVKKSEPEYSEFLKRRLTDSGVQSSEIQYLVDDRIKEATFELDIECNLSGFGRSMRNKFLLLKPFFLTWQERLSHEADSRALPYVIRSEMKEEEVIVSIPEGFYVEDHAEPVFVETDFARFELSYQVVDGDVVCKRSLRESATTLPPERYDEFLSFYEQVYRACKAPVLLARIEQ